MSYFSVDAAFWTDSDVMDDFTPEDKYFYLYLLTNPHANVSGCFELSMKQAAAELGYSRDTVERLIARFSNQHKVIDYDKETKELLIIKWGKYHWTKSDKYIIALRRGIESIKTERFKKYLRLVFDAFMEDGLHTVWIPYTYGMETTFTFSYIDNPIVDSKDEREEGVVGGEEEEGKVKRTRAKKEEEYHKHGEYGWVKLTDKQYQKLLGEFGQQELDRCIQYVDESAQGNHNRNGWTDWNLVIRKCHREGWGLNMWNKKWGGSNASRRNNGNAEKGSGAEYNIHVDVGGP